MRIRSMRNPIAASWPLSQVGARALIAAKVGSGALSTFRLVGSCFRRREFRLARLRFLLRAAACLRLAALEVLPQRRAQPRLPRRLVPGLGALDNGRASCRERV